DFAGLVVRDAIAARRDGTDAVDVAGDGGPVELELEFPLRVQGLGSSILVEPVGKHHRGDEPAERLRYRERRKLVAFPSLFRSRDERLERSGDLPLPAPV